MNSKEIIDSISTFYRQFQTMPNLEMHMRRVADAGRSIALKGNSSSITINNDDSVAALLLPDLFNVAPLDDYHLNVCVYADFRKEKNRARMNFFRCNPS